MTDTEIKWGLKQTDAFETQEDMTKFAAEIDDAYKATTIAVYYATDSSETSTATVA